MSQPYPGGHPGRPQLVPVSQPKYRPLRWIALVSVVLMGLTCLVSVLQAIALWMSYDDVKRLIYGLVSETEIDRGVESIAGAGPLLDLAGYLFLATGVSFVVWLWRARENSEVLRPAVAYQGGFVPGGFVPGGFGSGGPVPGGFGAGGFGPGGFDPGGHRHAQGWVVGAWVCPIVQFWYPLQVVEDVVRASEPPTRPGFVETGRVRTLLFTWWGTWVGFWVVLVGGTGVALISFVSWLVRLAEGVDEAEATGAYVDIYDLQTFMVRVALGATIGSTIAAVLLVVAGAAISLLLLQVTRWQDDRLAATGGVPFGPMVPGHSPSHLPDPHRPQDGPPQYAPRPAFPSYSPRQAYGPEAYGGSPGQHTYGPGAYRGTSGYLQPSGTGSVAPSTPDAGPYGPGGYGGTVGSNPYRPADDHPTSGPAPRADHPTGPTPTGTPGRQPQPGGATPWQPPH